MKKPNFDQVVHFNDVLIPRLRQLFISGFLKEEKLLNFLESCEDKEDDASFKKKYVIFYAIPEDLKEIITEGHAYFAYEEKDTQCRLFLDNDFGHWINKDFLRLCPQDEVEERIKYHYANVA